FQHSLSTTYRIDVFTVCRKVCRNLVLLCPSHSGAARLIRCLANNLNFGMLIPHGSFHIFVAHREHDCLQVAGLLQNPSAVVVSAAIENQVFREASFFPGLTKAIRHRGEMTRPRTLRGKYPSVTSVCATCPEQV